MKPSEIFRMAAKNMEKSKGWSNAYCCNAISQIVTGNQYSRCSERKYFSELIGGKSIGSDGWYGPLTKENKNARIIALCLAAAIAESEGK